MDQSLPKNQFLPFTTLLFFQVKFLSKIMSSFTNTTALLHAHIITTSSYSHHFKFSIPVIRASYPPNENQNVTDRRRFTTTLLVATSLGLGLDGTPPLALAQNWGTRSFLRERFFEPDLSPEDSAARIKQTAEGLHSMREMLERMAWRYVIFYIRLKSAYLSEDLKAAMSMVPEARRRDYVNTANDLIDNMALFDGFVRTPKVYESYLYYEKTLKNLDDIVAMFG